MSDRIAVMRGGRIEQVGPPEDLYDRPATAFVADFIGTTNLLRGTVESIADGAAVVRLDSGDRCRIAPDGRQPGQAVQLSIRPEAISVDGSNEAMEGLPLHATIEQVAYLGAAVQYQIRTQGGLAMTVLAGKSGPRFESGQAVRLAWLPAEALVIGDRSVELEDEA